MKRTKKAKNTSIKNFKEEEYPLDRDMSYIFDLPFTGLTFMDTLKLAAKDQTITLRMNSELILLYKKLAKAKKTKYQKLIREALIEFLLKQAA